MASNQTNTDVTDLLSQLQSDGESGDVSETPETELTKEELEQFIIQKTSKLITDSLKYISDIGPSITAAPDSKDVEALAKLIGASAAAIESLNKIHIADQKNKTSIGIKQMDIESKRELQANDHQAKLLLNREDLLKELIDSAQIIEAEIEELESN